MIGVLTHIPILILILHSIKRQFESIAFKVVEVKTEELRVKLVEVKEEEVRSEDLNASEFK